MQMIFYVENNTTVKEKNIFDTLKDIKIIPVVALEDTSSAPPLGEILINNHLPCAEITFRTEAAVKIIETLKKQFPEMLIGAGTVLHIDQAKRAADAGASFFVSPGFDPKLVEFCLMHEYPVIPGVATASEIQVAYATGLRVLKFFPATLLGGVKMIKALTAPFQKLRFVPTGGISKENIREFLACDSVLACGGTWLVKKDLLEHKNFDAVNELVAEAVDLVHRT